MNFSVEQIEEADRVARENGLARFVAAQNRYSLVRREAEDGLLSACERLGIGMLPFFPLESGLLTGKYSRGVEATEGRLAGRADWLTDEAFDRPCLGERSGSRPRQGRTHTAAKRPQVRPPATRVSGRTS